MTATSGGVSSIEPCLFTILGGTGDLNRRKLLPALYRITTRSEAPFVVLGLARTDRFDDASFSQWCADALVEAGVERDEATAWCRERVHFESLGAAGDDDWRRIADRVHAVEREHGLPGNRIFYLALPPGAFPGTITALGKHHLNASPGWTRLVIEKPFGRDLGSARELNAIVHSWFDESQVYRIDHYLGKETVQNLLAFRFANTIFEPVWNRNHIESVQITVAESLGIEGRGAYYERSGALRDMVQNHLTQLVTLVAMEAPSTFHADAIRGEKVKVLESARTADPNATIFGQYVAARSGNPAIPGYREENGVKADSKTETFVAGRRDIRNWRWQGVPFYFRTGKAMPAKRTEIAVTFKQPPICLFESFGSCDVHSNALVITLQPDEGFALYLDVKVPGDESFRLATLPLRFRYDDAFDPLPDAYQTLCQDVLTGDATLFVHAAEVEGSWKLWSPVLDLGREPDAYEAGRFGPPSADALLARDGHSWRNVEPARGSEGHDTDEARGDAARPAIEGRASTVSGPPNER